jgi:hypothetical protein
MNLTPDIYNTIYGFVYLSATFFLILYFAKISDLSFLQQFKSFAPFISIVVLFLSYVVGQIAYIVSEGLFGTYDAQKEIAIRMQTPEKLQAILSSAYATLVTIRHLIAGSALLGVSIFVWLGK